MTPLSKREVVYVVLGVLGVAWGLAYAVRPRTITWELRATDDTTRGTVCFAYTRGADIKPAGCLWTLDRPAQ